MLSSIYSKSKHWRLNRRVLAIFIAGIAVIALAVYGIWRNFVVQPTESTTTSTPPPSESTPDTNTTAPLVHRDITATMFWVGEQPNQDNRGITNVASAWIGNWVQEFGGVDSPENRCGYRPCAFVPKENPFYYALPFNDYYGNGTLKPAAVLEQIPWYKGQPEPGQSLVKNRWIAVTFQDKTVYGQWEDAGPFGEDDAAYVFNGATPQQRAGLDLSPAMNDYLGVGGEAVVSWHFVADNEVPDGPWKQTITTSGPHH